MTLILEHPETGIIKKAPVGFSWTTLFFCGLPALLRGDFKWFIIQQVLLICTGVSLFIFPFIYNNKIYIKNLLEKGFKVTDVKGGTLEDAKAKLGVNLQKLEAKK